MIFRSFPRPALVARLLGALASATVVGCVASAPRGGEDAPHAVAGSGGTNAPAQAARPYVVLVSLDGFRSDYIERFAPPALAGLAARGARAENLIPVFPSKTFPNHYSIVTGLRAEHHGIVSNHFWDPARGARFTLADTNAVRDGSWFRGEPLWVTAERQGMVAASYFWPGSEAAIAGVRPTFWKHYDTRVPMGVRVDTALAWLRLPPARRPHLVTLYASDVDDSSHVHGPEATPTAASVLAVDREIGRLLAGLDALPFRDSVYVIVVSDHGMSRSTPQQYVALETLVDTAGVRTADAGPSANLHVAGGPARARLVRDSINRRIVHGRAYLRADVPARLHYRADPRIGDVVVIMDEPWQVGLGGRRPRQAGGTHGWDPASPCMRGILVVAGPRVRRGATFQPVDNVDIYPFVAELLGLVPAARIDGRAGRIAGLALAR